MSLPALLRRVLECDRTAEADEKDVPEVDSREPTAEAEVPAVKLAEDIELRLCGADEEYGPS